MPKLRLVKDEKFECTQCFEFKFPFEFYKSNQKDNTHKLTYLCKDCSKKKINEYRNTETGFWVSVWNNLINGAKTRGLEVTVKKEDILTLWENQKGLCAITKLPMQKAKAQRTTRSKFFNQYRASVDRIDSEKGYTKDNIRLVCAYVNVMKLDQTDEQLKFWCKSILKGIDNA